MMEVLGGVRMELEDAALPLLAGEWRARAERAMGQQTGQWRRTADVPWGTPRAARGLFGAAGFQAS